MVSGLFKRSVFTIGLVILVLIAIPWLYKFYDQWRWSKISDTDLIQSIAKSLPISAAKGRKLAVISHYDEREYHLLRGYTGISPEVDYILEPANLEDLAKKLSTLGRGQLISRLTFFGHGMLKNDSVALKFVNYDKEHSANPEDWEINHESFIKLQKSYGNLPSAFISDAQVVFFNCLAGRDDRLIQAVGEAFLGLRGGKVIANRNKVKFDISYGGELGDDASAIIVRMDRPLTRKDWREELF